MRMVRNMPKIDWYTYSNPVEWWVGVWAKWRIILASAFVVWVSTNGLEVCCAELKIGWLTAATAGMGISWKASVVQGIIHAIWAGAVGIADRAKQI